MSDRDQIRIKAEVRGIVQGVGFRPFVYGLARRFGLSGLVRNTSYGAFIEVEGSRGQVENFFASLSAEAPPLAKITAIQKEKMPLAGESEFTIDLSQATEKRSALISPDVAVCPDCLREMFDPQNRRYRYPFINCTNCGPRYTIIMDVPYDRAKTSMGVFDLCPECAAEYHDPADRRFHAQPNACPVCGPSVELLGENGQIVPSGDPIEAGREILKKGLILAVKGLGGFHLAVDAENQAAVVRLRQRKRREEKPLAVMSPDVEAIQKYALVDDRALEILTSIQRPIVLLEKKNPFALAPAVAPDNRYIGAFLPYTPLHYLLLPGFTALVMTSGNLSEEPIVRENREAAARLSGIADFFLVHNRDIYLRTDDSVVRAGPQGPVQVRRSRGYAPGPIFLAQKQPEVLAVGGELKSTICLTKEDRAFVSQHIGDLENVITLDFFEMTIEHLKRILDIDPKILAFDLHPEYLSTKWALEQSGLETIGIQHHHAHIVSALAEHGLQGPVIGLACDGTGYGLDGRIWGGEILLADYTEFKRWGHFEYIPLPGGAAAIREPWRMAVGFLRQAFGPEARGLDLEFLRRQDQQKLDLLWQVAAKGINSPETSSLGRLFDAAASLIGLKDKAAFEGQAAMMLEMICPPEDFKPYPLDLVHEDGQWIIQSRALFRELVRDLKHNRPGPEISGRFHASLVRALAEASQKARAESGLKVVVLSGGCFQNRILTEKLTGTLLAAGFTVHSQHLVPANDGGLSLGQAVSAGRRR